MMRRIGTAGITAFALMSVTPAGAADWSGLYAGANVGYGWAKGDTRFNPLPSASTFVNLRPTTLKPDPSGAVLGAQVGYNWQNKLVLYGVEGDLSWSDMSDTKKVTPIIQNNGTPFPGAGFLSAGQDTKWFGTVRGRIGYVPSPQWLAFLTVGVAMADVKYSADSDFRPVGTEHYPASFSKTKVGWTAGAGAEWALAPRWSVKAEYLYYNLGKQSRTVDPAIPLPPFQIKYEWDTQAHIARAGVNYKF